MQARKLPAASHLPQEQTPGLIYHDVHDIIVFNITAAFFFLPLQKYRNDYADSQDEKKKQKTKKPREMGAKQRRWQR